MSQISFPGGAWPVMLTPFTKNKKVDYKGLEALTNWYIENGCSGLFADCQSSEMFFLTKEERIKIAKTVIKTAAGRVPVIASGHISDSLEDQIDELKAIAKLNPAALIFITNRFAAKEDSNAIWRSNLKKVMSQFPADLPLGLYECPYPYKRLLDSGNLKFIADTGRFYFLKDTCCDLTLITKRAELSKGSNLKIYNANTSTLLESLKAGCHGFCGVMASFQMKIYAYLCAHLDDPKAQIIQDLLSITSLIELQYYPVNAKYYLQTYEGLPINTTSRTKDAGGLTDTFKMEVGSLKRLTDEVIKNLKLKL